MDAAWFWKTLQSSMGRAPGCDPGVALHPGSWLGSLHQHRERCCGVSDHVVWETLCFRALKGSVTEMPGSWEAEEFSCCGPCRPPPKLETSEIPHEPDSPLGLVCSVPSETWQLCHVQPAAGGVGGKNGLWVRMLYITHQGSNAVYYSVVMLSSQVRSTTGQRVIKNM